MSVVVEEEAIKSKKHIYQSSQQAHDSNSSRQARAKRLKRLRKITTLSRKDFSEKYDISPGTLQNWETARFGGLTEKGARAMLDFLVQENIHCTFEWLMYGAGSGPVIDVEGPSNISIESVHSGNTTPYHTALKQELEKFYQLHENATHLTVMDDAMAPQFIMGETIAGIKTLPEEYQQAIDQCCIVDTIEYGQILRLVRIHSQTGGYCLMSTNPNTPADKIVLSQVTINSIAPVVWKRRQDL
jgi:DNA-binding transcriptional regulator YiaG